MPDTTRQTVLFPGLAKPTVVAFDAEATSSDGGLVLLRQLDDRLGLTAALVGEIPEPRQEGKIQHPMLDLVRQRVFGIALGYADCNDGTRLRHDGMFKLALDRDPVGGRELASQPVLSRFENCVRGRDLVQAMRRQEELVLAHFAHHHRRARQVVLDFDGTQDQTHGQQHFSGFNAFYDSHCFQPLLGFVSVDDAPDQFLFFSRLRPGRTRGTHAVIPALRRAVCLLQAAMPKTRICVRLDGGFSNPRLLEVLEELGVRYAIGQPKNAVLQRGSAIWQEVARHAAEINHPERRFFGELLYRAGTWCRERRVIYKAETVEHDGREPKDNTRYVVTNFRGRPERVYTWYCQRANTENRIKELKLELQLDRTSCTRYLANQLRVTMTAIAYALLQELRRGLRDTELRSAQVGRLQLVLLKVAARITSSVRRIVLHLPVGYPWRSLWQRAANFCLVT